MKKLIFLLALLTGTLYGQELSVPVNLLTDTEAAVDGYAGRDPFGWYYTMAQNEFRKQKDGRMVRYKAVSLGAIARADLQNPLQVVLFYKKFNTAVLLDNQLNETARFNFNELQLKDSQLPVVAEAVGLASQNRLWVYDINSQQVGLFDPAPRTFKTLTPPFNETLRDYASDYNYFYWTDETNSLYAVNVFGKVSFLGELPQYEHMQLVNAGQVLLLKHGGLYLYTLKSKQLQNIDVNQKSIANFYYTAQILTIFTGTHIIEYNITLPE